MTCIELEILITDYLDGTLAAAERSRLQEHLAGCESCRSFAQDVTGAVQVLGQARAIEPPPDLITRIAYQAPLGRLRDPGVRQALLSRWLSRWLQPVLQPRLVMSMAMTILSFAMLERCTGVKVQHLQVADMNPVQIWGAAEDKVLRVRDRALRYYENLRWVYEIEVRIRTLQEQQDAALSAQQQGAPAHQNRKPAASAQSSDGKNGESK